MTQSAGLLQLPYQLLVDAVLPLLDLRDLVRLRAVSQALRNTVDDEVVWRRRIVGDFQFPLLSSARTSGWKTLYRGLSDPELYTWGDHGNDRLGVDLTPRLEGDTVVIDIGVHVWNLLCTIRMMPFPLHITWKDAEMYDCGSRLVDGHGITFERPPPYEMRPDGPHKHIEARGRTRKHGIDAGVPVELHAGGWSFFALTHVGQILAWGSSTGDGSTTDTEDSFKRPTILDLAGRTAKQLSVGREHTVARMDDGGIFEWSKRWDRPAVHSRNMLIANVDHPGHCSIKQIEAGWDFSALLVEREGSGTERPASEVVIWKSDWTHNCQRTLWYERTLQQTSTSSKIDQIWHVDTPAVKLPTPPEKIERIAAGDRFILALTEEGGVYYLELPDVRAAGPPNACADQLRQSLVRNYVEWSRLTLFCDDLRASGENIDGEQNAWDRPNLRHLINDKTKITHISAQFKSFAVYAPDAGKAGGSDEQEGKSCGVVILGGKDRPNEPVVIPELQGIGVIKVVHGDWHSGALTLDGRVLTWGTQSNGALGSWDSVPVPENARSVLSKAPPAQQQRGPGWGVTGMAATHVTGVFRNIMRARQDMEAQADSENQDRVALESTASADRMVKAEKDRFLIRRLPNEIEKPQLVRFGFPQVGERRMGRQIGLEDDEETKYVFDVAFAGWHSGALAVDRRLLTDEV